MFGQAVAFPPSALRIRAPWANAFPFQCRGACHGPVRIFATFACRSRRSGKSDSGSRRADRGDAARSGYRDVGLSRPAAARPVCPRCAGADRAFAGRRRFPCEYPPTRDFWEQLGCGKLAGAISPNEAAGRAWACSSLSISPESRPKRPMTPILPPIMLRECCGQSAHSGPAAPELHAGPADPGNGRGL